MKSHSRLAAGLFATVLAASLYAAPLTAQEPNAPPSEAEKMLCTSLQDLDQPLTEDQLRTARLCREIEKLREEIKTAETTNSAISNNFGFLIPWAGVITGLLTALLAVMVPLAGILIRGSFERSQQRKFEQERVLQREAHNLQLMEGIGSANRAIQLASVSSLLRRVQELRESDKNAKNTTEYRTIADMIVSVLRDPQIDIAVSKYLADEMVNVFKMHVNERPEGAAALAATKLADFNMQRTRLANVYWAKVVADKVDFFGADLSEASLRGASLIDTVFYEANLRGAVLESATLKGANLQGAILAGARLGGTDFTGAVNLDKAVFDASTKWDERTIWPAGFTPQVIAATA